MKRKPLAIGNVYVFPNHPGSGFIIKYICFPGTRNDYGGIPVISLEWFNIPNCSYWYLFKNDKYFWKDIRFKNAVSK